MANSILEKMRLFELVDRVSAKLEARTRFISPGYFAFMPTKRHLSLRDSVKSNDLSNGYAIFLHKSISHVRNKILANSLYKTISNRKSTLLVTNFNFKFLSSFFRLTNVLTSPSF